MKGDQNKFLNLKRKEKWSVICGDDVSVKIFGKGTISLGNNIGNEENAISWKFEA